MYTSIKANKLINKCENNMVTKLLSKVDVPKNVNLNFNININSSSYVSIKILIHDDIAFNASNEIVICCGI